MIRKRTILSLALLASTAACGGGGGGGSAPPAVTGSAATGQSAAATAPSTNVANPQVTTTPDGKTSFANDQTSQTVTENGSVTTVHVAGVIDQSFDFANDPPNTTVFNADNSPYVQIDKTGADGNKVSIIKFNDGTQLDATSFGIWQTFDATGTKITASGAFATGVQTPADQMPTSGSATYAGHALGTGQDSTGSFTVTGTSAVSANFASRAVVTDINLNKGDQQFVALHSADGMIAPNSSNFAGTIQGGGMNGGVQGAFFGTSTNQRGVAGEVGGVFAASGGGASVNGGFAAAQTSKTP